MACTSGDAAPRPGRGMRLARKRRRRARELVAEAIDALEAEGPKGGPSMLRAWFGRGLLKRRVTKGADKRGSVYRGYKGRSYRVRKLGGRRYQISRVKG